MSKLLHYTLVPLFLRLILGVVFIVHGLGKIDKSATSWAGDTYPGFVQLLVSYGELLGGAAVIIGVLTRFAAAGLALIMAGAVFLVHFENGFLAKNNGFEYPLTLLVISVCVALTGSGALGFDHWFKFRNKPKQ